VYPEVLARINRLFGMSLGLLQETQNSHPAMSILAGGTAITMLTNEWKNNPLRVAVATQARRITYALWAEQAASLGVLTRDMLLGDAMGLHLAGGLASVQAQAQEYSITPAEVVQASCNTMVFTQEFRAEGLGIVSGVTGRGDGLAMNIAGGAASVQAQAQEYSVSLAEVAQAAHGTAGYVSAIASETSAADLDIFSGVTGRGDGLAMNFAGGAASVQAQALEYGITPDEVAQAARGTAGYFSGMASELSPIGCAASALAGRGTHNPNKSTKGNYTDAKRLGDWDIYLSHCTQPMTATPIFTSIYQISLF